MALPKTESLGLCLLCRQVTTVDTGSVWVRVPLPPGRLAFRGILTCLIVASKHNVLKIRAVRAKFYVLIAFYFKCQALVRGEKQLLFPVAAKPLWAQSGLAAGVGLGRDPRPPCAFTGCSGGGGSVHRCVCILFIHVDYMLFYSYTYVHIFSRGENSQYKILTFLDFALGRGVCVLLLGVWVSSTILILTLCWLFICKCNFMIRCQGPFRSLFCFVFKCMWTGCLLIFLWSCFAQMFS